MGGISLTNFKSEGYKSIAIGYWMGEEYANKGYMRDSLKIICFFVKNKKIITSFFF